MDTDEAFSVVVNEGEEVGFLLGVHFKVAAGEEQDGIEIVQIFRVEFQFLFGERFGVGADGGVPEARVMSKALDGGESVRDGFVAVAFLLADSEELFARVGRLGGERGSANQDEEKKAEFHGERIAGRVGGSDSAGTMHPSR